MKTIDARGLSCPQPVLLTLEAIKEGSADEMVVLVDNETAKENVTRAVTSQGWQVAEIIEEGDEYKIVIRK
ncbi:sulfurtransferase TusA family protein [Thermodesulfatator atlanticus]|uniref:sulfurtransferase TusA family protein n=1 Tax=Thermodesulfatator atlanticus TaxID=501497 RepID=UPI0003B32468|nr:sulfurtransferase TusA family protein [Thermodesulfatator atlanticus]